MHGDRRGERRKNGKSDSGATQCQGDGRGEQKNKREQGEAPVHAAVQDDDRRDGPVDVRLRGDGDGSACARVFTCSFLHSAVVRLVLLGGECFHKAL